jgi:hypothetical protein
MSTRLRKLSSLPLLLLLAHDALGLAIVCSDEPVTTLDTSSGNERVIWTYYDYWYSGIFAIGERLVEQAVPALNAYTDANLFPRTDEALLVAGYPAGWGMDSYLNIGCVPTGTIDSDADDDVDEPGPDDVGAETLIL